MENSKVRILATSRGPVEYMERGTGEVILSLHGAMGGYNQADLLARTVGPAPYRYVSLSRPGYLGTPLAAAKTPEEQADLYAEVIQLLHIDRVIVMAISGGGPSALYFALRHRDRCRGLVLISTCGGKLDNKVPLSFHIMTFLARWTFLAKMMQKKTARNLRESLRHSVSDPDILERTLKDAEVMTLFGELAVGVFDNMAARIPGTRNDIQITQTTSYPLQDIAVPTLVVHGTKDPLVPFEEHGKRLATEIPGAQLLAVEGGEHVTIFTHRREVQTKVAAFLEELERMGEGVK